MKKRKLRVTVDGSTTSFLKALEKLFTPERDQWRYLDLTTVYITAVELPVVDKQHKLPPDLMSKQQNDRLCQRICRTRHIKIFLATCDGKGWGVFAAQKIELGEFVGEYTGELISSDEMRRRYQDFYDRQSLNYVLSLREHVGRQGFLTVDFDVVRTNVDASRSGNFTRFINHSCSPNLDVEAVRVDSFVPRLAFFARKHINGGEELTFDYGGASIDAVDGEPEKNSGNQRCSCKAMKCRGFLPFVP
ncbi:hypothetical protein PsorP6_006256 [Peronosclerospora sorghi]|uniref:Uncharacterized protein n=1 Tax=Peronosclerospora sorghi TaxID=230839 RepID=A0ACC0W3Q1_9STRA|nr:hypothetical protein PsorP6_006256 [Peronosclerospora sorghi]